MDLTSENLLRYLKIWRYKAIKNKSLWIRRTIGMMYIIVFYFLFTFYYSYYSFVVGWCIDYLYVALCGIVAYLLFVTINHICLKKIYSRQLLETVEIMTLILMACITGSVLWINIERTKPLIWSFIHFINEIRYYFNCFISYLITNLLKLIDWL